MTRGTSPPRWVTTLLLVTIAGALLWSRSQELQPPPAERPLPPQVAEKDSEPANGSTTIESPAADESDLVVKNVAIRDQSGRVVYRGDIDLARTLDRIERGERHSHRNDGGTFRNLEDRLPTKSSGYYREYVHPTEGLDGPGPQRVILGQGGEVYYTADHYQSFKRIR
jgi:ribonuclease T1